MKCPECNADMVLRDSKYGKFYGCSTFPQCRATHGAHPNGKPLGFPANKELKELRMKAHRELEKHFGKWDTMLREDKARMYKWLKKNTSTGHIGGMTAGDIDDLLKKMEEL